MQIWLSDLAGFGLFAKITKNGASLKLLLKVYTYAYIFYELLLSLSL